MIIGGSFGQTVSGLTLNYIGRFTDSGNPLPVELAAFEAVVNGNSVVLKWRTSSENNNRGFEVERQVLSLPDGKAGSQSSVGNSEFISIGYVEGHGTSTEQNEYSFIDKNTSSEVYQYRLKQIDYDGSFVYSKIVEVDLSQPVTFSLEQNYPNPFNPSTSIQYTVGNRQYVSLKVFDVLGNKIATLVNEEKPAGIYEVTFNADEFSSGMYFYTLQTGNLPDGKAGFIKTNKMVLLK
ncbi:MAG: T9SS type A sorting domain-containing protein [Ignavibacteriales bacterium]|nr:MAG: T9SS type A sorting domain-containing protein [Ignavibacteriales bacterium]